jgi:phosphoadenosine phosphosulfate reductase
MNQIPLDKFGITLEQKIADGIQLLQEFESSALEYSPDGYYLCFSGGKDSVVVKDIAIRSGVKFTSNYSVTTIDPPELTRFIKHHHPDVIWHRPKVPLMKMVEKKGLPTRRIRWCCEKYKEQGGNGMVKIMGIRSAESPRRAKVWGPITFWKNKKKGWVILPILSWSDKEVWSYIKRNCLPYCSLYDEDILRLGCVGCPMSSRQKQDFYRWPWIRDRWRRAASVRWKDIKDEAMPKRKFKNSDEWFDWWMSSKSIPKENDCQMGLF